MPIRYIIGENMGKEEFESIRIKIGWSKRELAKRLGVHERTVHRYINGMVSIPELASKMMKAYNDGYRPKEE